MGRSRKQPHWRMPPQPVEYVIRKRPRRQATQRIQAHTASAYGYAAVPSAKPNTGRDRKWLSPQEQTGMPVCSTTPCDTTVHTTQRRPGHDLRRGAFLIFSPSFLPRCPRHLARHWESITSFQRPSFFADFPAVFVHAIFSYFEGVALVPHGHGASLRSDEFSTSQQLRPSVTVYINTNMKHGI